MVFANTTIIFTKAHIEHPMERIFHAPVLPHGLGETHRITGKRGQEIALLDRDLTTSFHVGLDQTHAGDLRPRALDT